MSIANPRSHLWPLYGNNFPPENRKVGTGGKMTTCYSGYIRRVGMQQRVRNFGPGNMKTRIAKLIMGRRLAWIAGMYSREGRDDAARIQSHVRTPTRRMKHDTFTLGDLEARIGNRGGNLPPPSAVCDPVRHVLQKFRSISSRFLPFLPKAEGRLGRGTRWRGTR